MQPLFRLLSILYVIGIVGWFLLNIFFGDGFWWLTILNMAAGLLFVPLPIFAAGELLARRWRLAALLLIPLAIYAWTHAPYVPPIFDAHPKPRNVRVMTYNLLYSNLDFDGVAAVIQSVNPDLVALQEVEAEMMAALVDEFAERYPYYIVAQLPDWEWNTTVVFSRYPFVESEILDLEEIRPATLVRVEVEGKPITFISAHLFYYYLWNKPVLEIPTIVPRVTTSQNRQAEILMDIIKREQNDVILACDCNSKTRQSSYKMLRKELESAQVTIGWRFRQPRVSGTNFDRNPLNVDHILYVGDLDPVGAYSVEDAGGSDHRAKIADFRFVGE